MCSLVCTLIDNGKLTNQIARLVATVVKSLMAKEISKEIDEFYGKLEMKYYPFILRQIYAIDNNAVLPLDNRYPDHNNILSND